jgi:hypothetical protein
VPSGNAAKVTDRNEKEKVSSEIQMAIFYLIHLSGVDFPSGYAEVDELLRSYGRSGA